MPVSFNSPPRNFFLLGSGGEDAVTNFFHNINKSSLSDGQYSVSDIAYTEVDQQFLLSGSGKDANTTSFGWLEKRNYNPSGPSASNWSAGTIKFQSSVPGANTTLNFMKQTLSYSGDIIVGGKTNGIPWIAQYSGSGLQQWISTSYSGDVEYTSVACKSSNYYACGYSNPTGQDEAAFIEKFDSSGNPTWGKTSTRIGGDVRLNSIAANDRGEVVAVGEIDGQQSVGYVVKVDTATGDILWDLTIDSGEVFSSGLRNPVNLTSVYIDGNDQIYIVGQELTTEGGIHSDGVIFKYTAEGNLIWHKKSPAGEQHIYSEIWSDTEVEQTIILSHETVAGSPTKKGPTLIKYSKNGDVVFKRRIQSSTNTSQVKYGLDGDPSFYYILFVDEDDNVGTGASKTYNFGKVSASGNGFGAFTYDATNSKTISYNINSSADRIGRLSDGSVRNDSSDNISYPYSGLKTLFDDYATNIAYKKTRHAEKDIFLYSGSPSIRVADFQEMNLLGDVYSGSGDWLDQSGKGNDATTVVTTTTTTTTTTGGTTESENFGTGGSITYNTYGTVVEGATASSLPYSTSDWDHYNSKVRDLQDGGFKITTTNSATTDFFIGCWVKFETYAQSRQMGINLSGNYIYWETLVSGKVGIRHNGGSRQDSTSGTGIDDGNWHYISLSRNGNTLVGHVDGTIVISTTNGVSGNSIPTNADFWFFGGSGTSYNIDGKILDPIINIGSGTSGGYTTPTKPIIDSSGNFNAGSSGTGPFFNNTWDYASPAIAFAGSTTTTTTTTTSGPTYNTAGYWEFDGVDDSITVPTFTSDGNIDFSIETWFKADSLPAGSTSRGYIFDQTPLNEGVALRVGLDGTITTFAYAPNGSAILASGVTALVDTWYHTVCVFENGKVSLYVDGKLVDDTTGSIASVNGPIDESLYPFTLGASTHINGSGLSTEFFDGEIGEVRVYPRALTAAQVFQNYNATKTKYINEAPDTAPKIGPGIVIDSNLILNYDFGNRATYDSAQNLLKDNFLTPDSTDTGEYYTDEIGVKHKIYTKDANLNQFFGDSDTFSAGTYDLVVSMYVDLTDATSFDVRPEDFIGAPVTATVVESDIPALGSKGIMKVRYSNVSPSGSWVFAFKGTGTAKFAKPFLEFRSDHGRYIKTYGSAITAPTTVKNLSSSSYTGTINGAEFDTDGYFEFDGPPGLGAGDYINIGTTSTFNWIHNRTESGWAIEGWFWNDRDEEYGALISNNSGTGAVGFYMGQRNDSQFECVINKGTTGTQACRVLSTNVLDHNRWYHIVFVNDNYTIKLYIDGVLQSNGGDQNSFATGSTADAQTDLRIAKLANSPTWNLDGKIGEVRIYQTSLSATEVSQNFNATRGKYGV